MMLFRNIVFQSHH